MVSYNYTSNHQIVLFCRYVRPLDGLKSHLRTVLRWLRLWQEDSAKPSWWGEDHSGFINLWWQLWPRETASVLRRKMEYLSNWSTKVESKKAFEQFLESNSIYENPTLYWHFPHFSNSFFFDRNGSKAYTLNHLWCVPGSWPATISCCRMSLRCPTVIIILVIMIFLLLIKMIIMMINQNDHHRDRRQVWWQQSSWLPLRGQSAFFRW